MTVEQLLKEESFHMLKVINKNADLQREISTIESTETPDVASYLPKNTFLITTAMAYKNDQSGLCELIESLDKLPCAALAIKIGRFIHTLDPDVIATADKLSFPLIQIPIHMTLGEASHKLLAYLWDDQNAELSYALNTQKKFSNLILQGASTKAMLNNLGLVLKKPVALIDPFGGVAETNYTCGDKYTGWVSDLFELLTLYEKKNEIITHHVDWEGNKEKVSIYPINTVGKSAYYLFVFNSEDLPSTQSALVIEQVLLIFGFSMYKNLYVLCNAMKYKEELLNSLINKYKNEHWTLPQILSLGDRYGLKAAPYYYIIVVTVEQFSQCRFDSINLSHREERYILIYDWMKNQLKQSYNSDIIVFPDTVNYRYVILVQGIQKDVHKRLRTYHDKIKKLTQTDLVFSFGNTMSELNSIGYSYNEALESYIDGEEKDNISYIKYYRPKNATELLKTLSSDQVEGFCLHHLKSLAYPKDEMTLELRKTLKTYLDCRCSVTETANKMFLHRNTIKYRIKKCEDILGQEIQDSEFCFQLQLSLAL